MQNFLGGKKDMNNKSYINVFVQKICSTFSIDELIKVENFKIDKDHTGYLYAYKTERGIHIEVGVSIGDCNSLKYENGYCGHTLHEYLNKNVIDDTEDFVVRLSKLITKTLDQLDILAPIERQRRKSGEERIL